MTGFIMTVKELLSAAKFGELRNLGLGDDETEAVLSYLNLGLIELYKRFQLRNKEVIITCDDRTIYTLPSDFMWLVAAYGEVPESRAGVLELPINKDSALSVNTVGWNQVQIPAAVEGALVSLIYAASPPHISYTATGTTVGAVIVPGDSYWSVEEDGGVTIYGDLPLPAPLIEPLLHYIGYRAHGAINGNVDGENNTHYLRFDSSCTRIINSGYITGRDIDMDDRLFFRGFV